MGGNWVFGNKNGMSAAYRDLFINTSRPRMEYSDYPMPESYPDFPHHTQIAAYFDDLRRPLRLPRPHRLRNRRRSALSAARTARGRSSSRAARRAATTRCSSPTATTGTRAGPNRRFPGRTGSRASSCTRIPTSTTRSSRASGWRSWAWATRRWTSPWRPPTSPSARCWWRARASGSSPSTCSANRSTRCATTRGCPSRSASASPSA